MISPQFRLTRIFLVIGCLAVTGCGSTPTFGPIGQKRPARTDLVNAVPKPPKGKTKAPTLRNPAAPVINQREGVRG